MMTKRKVGGSFYVRLDFKKVEKRRIQLNMKVGELKKVAVISDDTWRRITREADVRMDTGVAVAKALGFANVLEILHPSKLAEFSSRVGENSVGEGLPGWEKALPASGPRETSNGLKYVVWKLKHRHEDDRWARGKEYHLGPLATDEQQRMRHYLVRHSKICNLLHGRSSFPEHITSEPDPGGETWWVLDRWTEGPTLEEVLARGAVANASLPRMMGQILEAIRSLHEVGVIRRELSPRFILLTEPDDSVVLTDFELGKLLGADPTVAGDWPGDPYQANEVPGKTLTEEDAPRGPLQLGEDARARGDRRAAGEGA